MHFRVEHTTAYAYDRPVRLTPHVLRLSPRLDGARLVSHQLTIEPEPIERIEEVDAHGNRATRVSFAGSTQSLRVASLFELDTLPVPALKVDLEPLPWTEGENDPLAAYRMFSADPSVRTFAAMLAADAKHHPVDFLDRLSRELFQRIDFGIRPAGDARAAHETLALGQGACRDATILFLEAARALGLAARFVSGYQAHADTADGRRYLHSWAEVFLPGAGWRGWDVTHGARVTDGHVALSAAPTQAPTMPIEGGFSYEGAPISSTLDYSVRIDAA